MSSAYSLRVRSVVGLCVGFLAACGGNPEVGQGGYQNGGSAGSAGSGPVNTGGSGINIPISQGGDDGSGGKGSTTTSICGNSELEPGEVCDDGNTAENDGCSASCAEVDLDFDCSVVGETCKQVVVCGNGVLEGAELCDDGSTAAGDGCSADCRTVEDGWVCVRPNKPCVAVSVCGNGVRERGEECDDQLNMSPLDGDGCDLLCQLEAGYDCAPGAACVKRECGNGVRTPDEACDDNGVEPNDGCSALCAVESGWRCNANGCLPICGDGLVRGTEACDDADRDSGDGCSAACTVEPFFGCGNQEPSVCVSSIVCGNSAVEPGEVCDPPGTNGCQAGCKSFTPDVTIDAVCGNDVIEGAETCDPPNGNQGCSALCAVQNGWTCPQAGVCFRNPFCGDNVVQVGEECDPPNVNLGCDATCQEEAGFTCVGLGPSTCVKPVCGNGTVEPGEQCDDGNNTVAGDGCHTSCIPTTGWVCPEQNMPCIPRCGDGLKRGIEQCDDDNLVTGDGCNAGCKVEPGFKCPTVGAACVVSVCGDGVVDVGEGCDPSPGNLIAGDGCGPTCQPEPTVTVGPSPVVNVACGDGLVTGSDECDDGNDDSGDGCSDVCVEESGWNCTENLDLPSSLEMRVTYRDFKANAASGGHRHFENVNNDNKGIAGQPCTPANQATCGRLDALGKPVTPGGFSSIPGGADPSTDVARFATWYRDTNTLGFDTAVVQDSLLLTQIGGATSEVYEFSSASHFPLNGRGHGNTCGNEVSPGCCDVGGSCVGRNYHFTTELRYFFQYKGGETLTFRGDDDVWVFINGRLAVDVGGVHCAQAGRVILGDSDSSCSLHGTDYDAACAQTGNPPACGLSAGEVASTTDGRFGLVEGEVYEIVLFHAERHTTASNFKLTLAGFLAPRSFCEPVCGDGVVVGDEACDDGANNSNTIAGRCNTTCTARSFCGDGTKQTGEFCDNGVNIDLYRTLATPVTACAPGCNALASCGDALLQAAFEDCDKGGANSDTSYGATSCKTNCKLGGYCGDGSQNGPETCDLGASNGKTYGPNSCGYDCKPGARCGDSIRNGAEECDDGADNGSAGSNCDATCNKKPYCGDGVKNGAEICDYGQFASDTTYGGCTDACIFGPLCGDGQLNTPFEECDDGTLANTGGYDGCTNKCDLGPSCGDAVLQSVDGEACDNGFNDDIYKENASSCGVGCTPPPACGDAIVQSGFEDCDAGGDNNDSTYEGCDTACLWGPYCGDANIDSQGGELCDDGLDNVSYAAVEGGCSYDCQPAPFCGDATRNGPEQCDLGAAANTGDYGTCNADCSLAPRCGDGAKQGAEECDDGPAGSTTCTIGCKRRSVAK